MWTSWTRVRIAGALSSGERFVFITGGAFTREATAFLDAGKTYLDKPFDMPKLRLAPAATRAKRPR